MGKSLQEIVEKVQRHHPDMGEAEIIKEVNIALQSWSTKARPRKEWHICLITDQRHYDIDTLLDGVREIDQVLLNNQDTTLSASVAAIPACLLGGSTTVYLGGIASTANDAYNDYRVRVTTTGYEQTRQITDYDGATQTATVATLNPTLAGTIDIEVYPSKYDLIDEMRLEGNQKDVRPTYV